MATLTVGLNGQFSTIAGAVNASQDGDTVAVTADHVYNNDFFYIGHSLTLQAVGGEVQLAANGSGALGKAAIVEGVAGANVTIQGFDISGVSVPDNNGAAIRYEGGNLTLIDDYFHNNQEGLLGGGDPNGTISVQHSEFAYNGDGSGFTHNFYAGAIASVTIDNSYFHDAVVGHEIKSRAASLTVTNSRVFDNNGSASYSIDAPNGGNLNVANNVIEQGPNTQNPYIFAYGEEGVTQSGSASIHDNTIVNDDGSGRLILGPASFTGNQTWGIDAGAGNVDLASRPSIDDSSINFIPGISAPTPTPTPTPEPPPDPPLAPPPEPEPSPPPPTLTLEDYHAKVFADFFGYFVDHHEVITNAGAIGAFLTEWTSPVVLTAPVPGDLWSQ